MPKISVEVGITFKLGGKDSKSMDFFRTTLNVSEIDTELPIQQQLSDSVEGAKLVFNQLVEQLNDIIDAQLNLPERRLALVE